MLCESAIDLAGYFQWKLLIGQGLVLKIAVKRWLFSLSLSNSGGLSQSCNQANADTALVLAGRYLMSPLDQLTCFNAPLPLEYEDTWSLSPDLRVTTSPSLIHFAASKTKHGSFITHNANGSFCFKVWSKWWYLDGIFFM